MTGVKQWVGRYIALGLRPMPMHGVTATGECRCGGWGQRPGKPCNPGKHSVDEDSWKNGRLYGVGDFTEHDNIAVALGPTTSERDRWLVCLDVDGPLPVGNFFPGLPATMTQQSPRGRHLFYSVPPFTPLGNWVDCLTTKLSTGTSVDIRYARGRINVAPSKSAAGEYTWLSRLGDPAPLPYSVIDAIEAHRRRRGLPIQQRWERDAGKRPG